MNNDILKVLNNLKCEDCTIENCGETLHSEDCIQDFFFSLAVCDYCKHAPTCDDGEACGFELLNKGDK